ncbi:DUF5103 domain-containing protein [Phaeodactylibacter xiamenensis]|jgi:hypothetical protein|uniref:type IX secretion system plug protein n=1 Tax=Phaeodactylibacter xiamenensis TaxID=1524460 RepID=UPI003BAB8E62
MKTLRLLFITLLISSSLIAQDSEIKNYDYVYVDHIRSVRFHVNGLVLSNPVVNLDAGAQLKLSFDDLDADVKDYFYSIVHCDRNWNPSNLQEMEYLDGFNEERIQKYDFSFKTLWPYTHYTLTLPNRDMRWRLSGNYLLLVYDESNDRQLVITRRFVVVEQLVGISPRFLRANNVSKLRTHQEIDFNVAHKQLNVQNPQQEITATVMQNGRWRSAITGIEPKFIRPELMIFDYQDEIVFPGGKEFRFADLRSFRRVSFNVASVRQEQDSYIVEMKADNPRDKLAYTTFEDLNGKFIIETTDQNRGGSRQEDLALDQLYAEYADVSFALSTEKLPGYDVYIVGGFTDWTLKDRYRLEYDPNLQAYTTWVILKQGYYDYMYAAVPKPNNNRKKQDRNLNISLLEGDSHETINEYTIIIYYRPFGSRYDRAVGSVTFTSTLEP